MKRRLLGALFLTYRNFATFKTIQNTATVNAYGYEYSSSAYCSYSWLHDAGALFILAWVFALFILMVWAMRRPLYVE